jgi:hypothetical protein
VTGRDYGFDVVKPETGSRIQVKGCRVVTDNAPYQLQWGDIYLLDEDRFDEATRPPRPSRRAGGARV